MSETKHLFFGCPAFSIVTV